MWSHRKREVYHCGVCKSLQSAKQMLAFHDQDAPSMPWLINRPYDPIYNSQSWPCKIPIKLKYRCLRLSRFLEAQHALQG